MKETLVTIEEAANAAKVSQKTLIRWEEQGYLHHIKKKNGIRYFSFDSILQIIDLKREPYEYLLIMDNHGELPNTINVVGDVTYDKNIKYEINSIDEIPVVALSFCTAYRKRLLTKQATQVKMNKPVKVVFLKHFKENNGPVKNSAYQHFVELQESKRYDGELWMREIWKQDSKYYESPVNSQTIPPKSFIGYECLKTEDGFEGRYIRYERISGQEWLAEEIR